MVEACDVAGVYLCRQRTGAGRCRLAVPYDDDSGRNAQSLVVAGSVLQLSGAVFINNQKADDSQPFLVSNLSN